MIDAETIDRRLIENTADLIKFEPGVYIESNLTRIGLNGFNIRGIGGNRVMTLIDGVETSEQFDFGPFNMHQVALDLDVLKSAEIVRSAGSSLYGSDALGGVVSFFTKDPSDYLGSRPFHIGGKTMFDGRSADTQRQHRRRRRPRPRLQASLFGSYSAGPRAGNKGTVDTEDVDAHGAQPAGSRRRAGARQADRRRSARQRAARRGRSRRLRDRHRGLLVAQRTVAGPTVTDVADIDAVDTMQRSRVSVDQRIDNGVGLHTLSWSAYAQDSDTDSGRRRSARSVGHRAADDHPAQRHDRLRAGQLRRRRRRGASLLPGGRALLFTFGGNYKHNTFDMLRDRLDINAATGAVVPPVGLILPTKYFPKSDVGDVGAYVQAEMSSGA